MDMANGDDGTALHMAARFEQPATAQALLEAGAKVDAPSSWGSPLHVAAWLGHAGVARVLVKGGARIDLADDEDGATPLHNAAEEGRVEVARVLLEAGASMSVKDRRGRTPLELATAKKNEPLVRLLLKATSSRISGAAGTRKKHAAAATAIPAPASVDWETRAGNAVGSVVAYGAFGLLVLVCLMPGSWRHYLYMCARVVSGQDVDLAIERTYPGLSEGGDSSRVAAGRRLKKKFNFAKQR